MEPGLWKIFQIGLSGFLALIGVFYRWYPHDQIKKKDANAEVDFVNFVFYKPLALFMLLYISLVITEMKYVNLSVQLNKRGNVDELSTKLNTVYGQFDNPHDEIITSIIDDKVNKFNKFLSYATNKYPCMLHTYAIDIFKFHVAFNY